MSTNKCQKCHGKYTNKKYQWCKPCQINYLKNGFRSSGNEGIDSFIQGMQLEINKWDSVVFEWIPYDQFNDIKEIGKGDFSTAIWKDGPLYHDKDKKELKRLSVDEKVALKRSQNINEILNEVKLYSKSRVYGISQNPNTNDYIMVLVLIKNDSRFSGNEKIDDFIQEIRLKIEQNDTIFEWIPYDQFREISKDDSSPAIWKDGPLYHIKDKKESKRLSAEKKVVLKYSYNLQDINEFLNEVKTYPTRKIYGISQNPNTKNYVMALNKDYYCETCGKETNKIDNRWCLTCHIKNDTRWTSGNEEIDGLVQEMQIKFNECQGNMAMMFEWMPYDWFNDIKEIAKDDFATTYSAIRKHGTLYYKKSDDSFLRFSANGKVTLKCLHNSRNNTNEILNKTKTYSNHEIYGISQNPDTKDYILVFRTACCEKCRKEIYYDRWCIPCHEKNNSRTSGNEKIDDLIKEIQLKFNYRIVFEWIPYDQFNDIKEIVVKDDFALYLAIQKDGSLRNGASKSPGSNKYDTFTLFKRFPGNKVVLKCLRNSQNITNEFLNEVKAYSTREIYGISQHPDTKEYIMVLRFEHCKKCGEKCTKDKWCKPCKTNYLKNHFTNWTSGSKKIDDLIQEMQLKTELSNSVFEWISYDQFDDIKKISKRLFCKDKVYSATWKDGPSYYNDDDTFRRSSSNQKVALNYLHNSQNIPIEMFLDDEIRSYSYHEMHGISQNPDTKDYIMVLVDKSCGKCGENYTDAYLKQCIQCQIKNGSMCTTGNEEVDDFIHKTFQWIPYNQFSDIKQIGKDGIATLYYSGEKIVALKCLYNLQDINKFSNEIKPYSSAYEIYGISQNHDTQNCLVVLDGRYFWHESSQINYLSYFTNWSGNKKIDDYIQEMQFSKIEDWTDNVFEWIPYDQFSEVKEIQKRDFVTLYSAKWKDGPLHYSLERLKSYEEVVLNCLSQNINEVLNKVKSYDTAYGISQNPDTKDYIIVITYIGECCIKCGEQYADKEQKWCKCQTNYLKNNFTNCWVNENEKINDLIKEMQLRINKYNDTVFEWISYDQFNNITEIGRGGFATVYSAIWKDGPLYHDKNKMGYTRSNPKKVALKHLHNSQNITKEFLNEIKAYSINYFNNILKIYGISQDPKTKEYIMVTEYANRGNLSSWVNKNYKLFDWPRKLVTLHDIIIGLKKIHEKQIVHRDFHTGNILISSASVLISDMGLCGEVDNIDETKIYGVTPYVAPEVLRGESYTKAADIYSFGMIMYFVATGKQPFANVAHDEKLILGICSGNRPEMNEPEVPKCYIDLMKRCWDLNQDNRPNIIEVKNKLSIFHFRLKVPVKYKEICKQFEEAEEYRNKNLSSIKNNQLNNHPQAVYTSRLLSPYTKSSHAKYLLESDECLDCGMTD